MPLTWKRHLSEYRSDQGGYTIRSPARGGQYSLVLPSGMITRHQKLFQAKEAAERWELARRRTLLGVTPHGHEIFHSIWGSYDVTVARTIAQQHGEVQQLSVAQYGQYLVNRTRNPDGSWTGSNGIPVEEASVSSADLSETGTAITIVTRGGTVMVMPIDGWERIARAAKEGVGTVAYRVLNHQDTALVKI